MTDLGGELAARQRADTVQAVLYRIAALASAAEDMQQFYEEVHAAVGELMDARNLYIALYDEERRLMNWPYYVDDVDDDIPDPNQWYAFGESHARGTTAYVLRTGEPQLLSYERMRQLIEQGEIELIGATTEDASWLGVPLKAEGRTVGVLVVQSYTKDVQYTENDRDLLAFVGQHVGAALSRARAIEETRQRNAELALINSVQDALARELELQAIYDVVGDRLRDVFDAQVVSISVYDENRGLLHFPYVLERGERLEEQPIPLIGFRRHVMETREPLLIEESTPEIAERYGNPYVLSGEPVKSCVLVPLLVGGRATGVISIQNVDRTHAFDEDDQRLLMTLAGSLSVALENARLLHETRRRNAELALINTVQESIAGELELQAIYDTVGDNLRDVFDAQVVDIALYDEAAGLLHFPYTIERGVRFPDEPIPLIGYRKHVMETREPLLLDESGPEVAERYGNPYVLSGEPVKSAVFVPLLVGGRATGVISLQNVDRPHAFDEDDQRLLMTLAGSLSVALENARLVHEMRQRVTELATVNSLGQALGEHLDLDTLIELAGEGVRNTFEADIAYVALLDRPAGRIDFAYFYESGERRPQEPIAYGTGLTSQIIDSREPLLLNRPRQFEELGAPRVGTPARSFLGVPILAGDAAIGVVSVQSIEQEGRFGEADARLLATIAASVGAALQNARLFAEVQRQRQYFESLVEISPVAIIVMDPDEVVTDWNPAAAELFGYTPEEAVGRKIDVLVLGDEGSEESRTITREALEAGRAQRLARRRRKDGSEVDVELMLVPLSFAGEHVGFYAIYHDVSELQQARQEAEAATQAKSAFLATMSHEIRTPMNAVIGMTGLLLATELTPEQREFAEVVRGSGDALLHVIDDILDYSKIEAGKLELERIPFDLRGCVETALDLVAPRAAEKSLELGCLVGEGVPAGIVGDGARLRQVLLNLLSNAVKFTESGEVVVHLEADSVGSGSCRVQLAVRDTGIGIPAERMHRLFESFSQVDASTTRRYGGTGLGLAISRRLVELMGGTMWAESEEGSGSTFHIEFAAEPAEVPHAYDATPLLEGKRLLVVDDNATNREIVVRQAHAWGMQTVAVALPSEALALVEAGERFDVAVLDMVMPEMDGAALARELRARGAGDTPLVLATSLGRLTQAPAEAGFAAQLSKPLKASQLYDALMRALSQGSEAPAQPPTRVGAVGDAVAVSPLRILLAEDNAVNQKVALALLKRLGYQADVVWNGLEVLDALDRSPYDVVLMDVQMPELDGLEATRRIHQRFPAKQRPLIIAMTANAFAEDREACLDAGMGGYVAKPVRADDLLAALRHAHPLQEAPA